MAITTTGCIWLQRNGVNISMHVTCAASLAKLKTFALALAAYTDAKVVEIDFTQTEEITGQTENVNGNVAGMQAMLLLHGEAGKTQSKKLAVPAPNENIFEEVAKEGVRVKYAQGKALADAYSALTEESFTFVRGRLS